MLVRIANREEPDQTASSKQSDLGLHYLPWPIEQATSVPNFRTFTILFFTISLTLKSKNCDFSFEAS